MNEQGYGKSDIFIINASKSHLQVPKTQGAPTNGGRRGGEQGQRERIMGKIRSDQLDHWRNRKRNSSPAEW